MVNGAAKLGLGQGSRGADSGEMAGPTTDILYDVDYIVYTQLFHVYHPLGLLAESRVSHARRVGVVETGYRLRVCDHGV